MTGGETNGQNGKSAAGSLLPPWVPANHPRGRPANKQNFFEDYGLWKEAPVLKGTTKFEPLPDTKNIMITGGAGFM